VDAAIVSAVYDGYDEVQVTCPQDTDCEWVLVTDDLTIPAGFRGWRVVHEPRPGVHPCRAAKAAKFRPWRYTTAGASVWVDASLRVESASFAADVLAASAPLAQFAHADRDCLFAEAAYSATLAKYAGEPLEAQAACYRAAGHPEHWGLWTGGVIGRRHVPEVVGLGDCWAAEVDFWSFQDQVSEPFVLRNLGLRPAELPGHPLGNPWVTWAGSGRH
jgi:hypothetical protein